MFRLWRRIGGMHLDHVFLILGALCAGVAVLVFINRPDPEEDRPLPVESAEKPPQSPGLGRR